MDLTSWIESTSQHANLNHDTSPCPPSSLCAISTHMVQTPSASNWTDISIDDGAGSDEGDTFKYECRTCRFICASVEELCTHLVTGERHIVCPVCLREFEGENTVGRERERWRHIHLVRSRLLFSEVSLGYIYIIGDRYMTDLRQVHPNLGSQRERTGWERRNDYRAVSKDAPELSLSLAIGLRLPTDEDEDGNEHNRPAVSVGGKKDTPSKPGVNGVVDESGPYYHWEPDMLLLTKFGGVDVDVDVLREEREREMQWLRGFEGV